MRRGAMLAHLVLGGLAAADHDMHVFAYRQHLRRQERAREETERRARALEIARPQMEAAEAKRQRKQAKRLALKGDSTDAR